MKIISIIGGRQHLMKAYSVHQDIKKLCIDHQIIDIGVYNHPYAKHTYKELSLPSPINEYRGIAGDTCKKNIKELSNYLFDTLNTINPDVIIVYGDITQSVAACYAAVAAKIPIAHIESGLRHNNLNDSEELNRMLIDHFSNTLFSTSSMARNNLLDEGIDSNNIFVVGNSIIKSLKKRMNHSSKNILIDHGLEENKYALITIHREENLASGAILGELVNSFEEISYKIDLVFIQYPDTQKSFSEHGLQQHLNNIKNLKILNTLSYEQYLGVLSSCHFIITDSSGIQDEALFLGKPCIICRKYTHREVAPEFKGHRLVGTKSKAITQEAYKIIKEEKYSKLYPSDWDLDIGNKVAAILKERYEVQ